MACDAPVAVVVGYEGMPEVVTVSQGMKRLCYEIYYVVVVVPVH